VGFAQVTQAWTLKMITWDSTGTMWGVGTEGNVGKWVP
ncbi:MAG: hypothetical protein JWN15_3434, partial [Firmicutes bacterium]|nr:hypothetical protein [Bacillota bacterium]